MAALNPSAVSSEDARDKEARRFCHGYLVGAFHYHLVTISCPNAKLVVCPPYPPPSRNAAITAFGRVAGMGAGYIYSKNKQASE